ncbi:PLP-dependent cysteine synthase family protein [Salmonella enterica]|uniref:L-cysteine desulfhydrase Cds1 n=1 Tax=Salmonella enterica subsp. enterica serovar Java TaxID=224729 RepID=A0A5V0EIC3_SALEB|nr:cysteine desulfhydrase [Salmonella enterica]EBS6041639.1 PLP-dependent cysteine synthase family protein [Salmonella enterica subsp. enterica serovar Java]ECC9722194.1 PLP-dependent cysteine synthase family protein [Salmonella enterica subsp. enterica]EAS8334300.1 PLP-dependent cysteine synthase family protein [Salmonella enterica]EAY4864717.1 PLP-dependent cysteine synthase family protein [Salmonella enterica]EBV1643896.1 PLP-dependent cysteine synthase family protein [Salmonella enterica s
MMSSNWVKNAINEINADHQRSADTHLIRLPLSAFPGIQLYLKDESTHPTGSLKHRLARSLFLYGLCNGWIKEGTPIIEASSGSTAISEAWFARLLGLPFIAVMPACTAKRKIEQIQFYGGHCHFVESACEIYAASERLAHELNGHYMDQFTYAERATDWRGNNNIADSIFRQMRNEPHPVPRFIVMSAGTGGTSATIGRYIRCQGYDTQLMVVDPENSVFLPYWQDRDASSRSPVGSKIEGIGRPRVEPSFIPDVVDEMLRVPDAASVATAHWLETQLGRKVGASTGTNMWGALQLAARMREAGETGAIVTLLCDSGDRYLDTYYHPAWVSDHIGDLTPWSAAIAKLLTGD